MSVFYNLDEALKGVDVIMMLRLQLERQVSPYFQASASTPRVMA